MVEPVELGQWLQRTVNNDAAAIAIQLAEGWVTGAVGPMAVWPLFPVPDDVWAWTLELAGLAYLNNPYPVSQRTVGGVVTMWDTTSTGRRATILALITSRYGMTGKPQGGFPAAKPWTDLSEPRYGYGYGYGYDVLMGPGTL